MKELHGEIVFQPSFRNADYLRGLQDFDYIWLIWEFSANKHRANSPVVRPPVLGGNERMGVFATRSPYRPNALGLSVVKIDHIEWETAKGPIMIYAPKRYAGARQNRLAQLVVQQEIG